MQHATMSDRSRQGLRPDLVPGIIGSFLFLIVIFFITARKTRNTLNSAPKGPRKKSGFAFQPEFNEELNEL